MKTQNVKIASIALAITSALAMPAHANVLDEIGSAVKDSNTNISLRYRAESVDQDGKNEDALASTIKTRLTWQSGKVDNFSALIEVDNVSYLGNDSFNSTHNGKGNYPVVADPDGTDLNQVNVTYTGEKLTATGGRQRINLGNQRFVGGVAWRQNEQTYDGARVIYKATDSLTMDYSWVVNVNRLFGPDDGAQLANWRGSFHFANTTYAFNKDHKITGFAYLLDNDDAATTSTDTFGVDYTGNFGVITANVSYATQSDSNDNPNNYTADYYKAELSGNISDVGLKAGIEVLGSDNNIGFSTPLATAHLYQGFADVFLSTPTHGIEDIYVSASTALSGVKLTATYHDFSSEKDNISYGTEIDLVAAYQLNKQTNLMLKFASYDADDFATDVSKVWFMATVAF